ncbi:hypothetical protein J6590_035956 [Homalodisca vitripennis]|nr:hypothetical protein J6590_035956 [Homalodisca vitripennis]
MGKGTTSQSHVPLEEGDASSEPASPVKIGRGWHTLGEGTNPTNSNSYLPQYTRPIELPMNPRISTFAVSDVPLLDIHKVAQIEVTNLFLLCPVVGSIGRYKPARIEPAPDAASTDVAFTQYMGIQINVKQQHITIHKCRDIGMGGWNYTDLVYYEVKVSGDTTSCRLVNKPERLSCVNRPAVVTLVKAKLPRPGRYNSLDFELHPVLRQVASAFHSSIHEARPTAFRLLKFL